MYQCIVNVYVEHVVTLTKTINHDNLVPSAAILVSTVFKKNEIFQGENILVWNILLNVV